jgi:hypothetical protein
MSHYLLLLYLRISLLVILCLLFGHLAGTRNNSRPESEFGQNIRLQNKPENHSDNDYKKFFHGQTPSGGIFLNRHACSYYTAI